MEANFRFDLARIREYSEQIALLKGEDREIERAGNVFADVFHTIRRIIRVRTWLIAFNQFYSQISVIIPYVVVAPFYYLKVVDFGRFSQSADAFGAVNGPMNFFVDRYIGLADFSAAIQRLTTFEDSFERIREFETLEPRIRTVAADGPILSLPGVDIALPDGRKLAHIGDLALVPQESTLVVGPSGVGKSTLFRAISGLWPFGSGEVRQPEYAKLMLLPQRPYIPIGALRDALAYPAAAASFSDAELREALIKVGLAGFRTGSTGTTTGRCTCRAASSSGWRSPAPCSRDPTGCSSTRRRLRWTKRARPTSIAPSRRPCRTRRWCRSATARPSTPSTSAASPSSPTHGDAPATVVAAPAPAA